MPRSSPSQPDDKPHRPGPVGDITGLTKGALLVAGAPGTGKSTALRERVLTVVREQGLDPSRIPLVTSTVRAAGDHHARIEAALDRPFERVQALTWEDLAEQLLREWPGETEPAPGLEVVGRAERLAMLLVRIDRLPLREHRINGRPAALLRSLIHRIDRVKRQRIDPPDDLAEIVAAHDRLLAGIGVVDRTDLPGLAAAAINDDPEAAAVIARRIPHLVIDELEDLTPARAELLAALAGLGPVTVTAALDPTRCRFGDGAEPRFLAVFPDARRITTERAWRLSEHRIALARTAVDPGPGIGWTAGDGEPAPVRFWRPVSVRAEVEAAAREVEHCLADGADAARIAIAVPDVDRAGAPVAVALAERGIAARLGGGGLFRQPEVRDVAAWLNALCDPGDSRSVTRALMRPPVSLAGTDLATLTTIARRRKIDLVAAAEAALESPRMPPAGRQRLQGFLDLHRAAGEVLDTLGPSAFLGRLIERVGLRRQSLFTARPEAAEALLGLSRLAGLADAFARREPAASTREFALYLDALVEGDLPAEPVAGLPDTGGIPVLSLDGLKGGEWDRVYALGLDRLPPEAATELAAAVTSTLGEVVLSRVGPVPAGSSNGQPFEAMLALAGKFETIEERDRPGQGEDLHALWSRAREELIESTWQTGSELNEPRLDVTEDINAAVTRYLELLKLAALARRSGGRPDREAIETINGLLSQVATPEQLSELEASGLDARLLDAERDRQEHDRLTADRDEPSLAAFLPRKGDGVRLSATDLDLYLTCPLKYKFARVFAIPRQPTLNMRFGILIHNLLHRFHQPDLTGEPPAGNGRSDEERLLELFEEGWRRGGFGESDDELQFRDRALTALRLYAERWRNPGSRPAMLERQFEFRVGDHWVRGRVDRVDRRSDGSLEVIDYKTGARVDSDRHGGDLQLSLYRVGAAAAWNCEVEHASYEYVMDGTRQEVPAGTDDRERLERIVTEVGDGVLGQDFEPKPSPSVCSWCDFRRICPASEA